MIYLILGVLIGAFILGVIAAIKALREDKIKPVSNPLNDAYLYDVWGIEQPHYNND